MQRFIPRLSRLGHGVEDGQELAHEGNQGDFFRLARVPDSVVESAQHRIEAHSDEGCHVEGFSDAGSLSEDGVLPTEGTGIPIEGRHTHQVTDFARQASPFRDFRNQCRDGVQPPSRCQAGRRQIAVVVADVPLQFSLGTVELLLQGLDDRPMLSRAALWLRTSRWRSARMPATHHEGLKAPARPVDEAWKNTRRFAHKLHNALTLFK